MINFKIIHRILLGLLMLIPGITKIFLWIIRDSVEILSSFPFPIFTTWFLIVFEIIIGILIISNWKLKLSIIPAIIILIVSAFTVHLDDPLRIFMHFIFIFDYIYIAYNPSK